MAGISAVIFAAGDFVAVVVFISDVSGVFVCVCDNEGNCTA